METTVRIAVFWTSSQIGFNANTYSTGQVKGAWNYSIAGTFWRTNRKYYESTHMHVTSAQPRVLNVIFAKKLARLDVCLSKKRNVHEVEVKHPVNVSEFSIPESAVFMGPIEITPLTVNAVTCKEKALLSVKIAPSSRRCQKTVTCKIDSGAETNIVPRSLYNLICDPPYKNTSYPQKCFLGGLRSL